MNVWSAPPLLQYQFLLFFYFGTAVHEGNTNLYAEQKVEMKKKNYVIEQKIRNFDQFPKKYMIQ